MAVKLSKCGFSLQRMEAAKFDGYLTFTMTLTRTKYMPDMAVGDVVKQVNSKPEQHFTPTAQLAIQKRRLSRL